MKINWIPQLQASEYPEGVLDQMEPSLFNDVLIPLRQRSGVSMTPSPLVEAHVRQEGTSRHSTKSGKRLSDASDTFIPSRQASVYSIYRQALRLPKLGGFGLYFDTKPSVMIHTDMRQQRLLWLRIDGEYIYELNDPKKYYTELLNQINKLKN